MIVIGCTTVAHKMAGDPRNWGAWLANAEQIMARSDDEVRFFASLEVDARGLEPFAPLIERLHEVDGTYWTFSLDDGVHVITSANRLRRICMGHNLVSEYAMETGAGHVLFLASDSQARDDVLPRLLELDAPVAACHIPTYCLGQDEHRLTRYLPWDVRSHMETCAAMLLRRDIFTRIKWRVDIDRGLTDDPCMHADVTELLGLEVLSRHDVLATHFPESVPPIEVRASDEVRRVHR